MLDTAEPGHEAVIDGDGAQLVLRPEAEVRQVYVRVLEAHSLRYAGFAALRDLPSVTADGVRVSLMLNVGLDLELAQLERTGADGIGLFRTEIAMLARGAVADVAEQSSIYARVLNAAGERPVLFRTLDLGADKLLPGTVTEEENPAMGWRSIRIGLDRPALMRRQLRALLLAANGRPLSVMFPMVATAAEFRKAKGLLLAEAKRVRPEPERLSIGTMLEVPALMWQLPDLLREADFISVGSNDLVQFMFAADRGTPSLYRSLRCAVAADVRPAGATADSGAGGERAGLAMRRSGVPPAGSARVRRPGPDRAVDAGERDPAGEGAAGRGQSGGFPSRPGLHPAWLPRRRQSPRTHRHLGARAGAAGLVSRGDQGRTVTSRAPICSVTERTPHWCYRRRICAIRDRQWSRPK